MRNAQMNDALVKTLNAQLARIALKMISNQKTTLELHWNHSFQLHNY